MLDVTGLDLSAGDKHLLSDVSFGLDRGEHVALVGPNGSGKTTLLETLLRPAARARRRPGVLLAAGGGARRARHRARLRPVDDGPDAAERAEPARPVPLLGLGGAPEGGLRALGRRAAAARAGCGGRVGRELPRARRADEPPRPREPGGARGCTASVSGDGAARLARPRAPRRGRGAHARDRGPAAERLRRRLGRLRPAPRGAARVRPGRARGTVPRACAQRTRAQRQALAPADQTEAATPARARRASRPRSRRRSRRSPSSSGSSPTTGRTSTPSRPTAAPARSSRRSSSAGSRWSSRPRPETASAATAPSLGAPQPTTHVSIVVRKVSRVRDAGVTNL